ncbi:hypothetical protein SCHPADRAFT_829091 [Schizopora paradoxa]|uniref:CCZ1/INTU/HSP4 first Longin domain-containing protein n=1 Tax=Schizopora paradoxa TaxID=27342 RepID=A0A0H2RL69_9AGAM|nr:hypothetical protein SCHPADRAFT_829091 [Schizopora paradoxa]
MASLPATLLYFVIYNPSLKRAHKHGGGSSSDEDEDADEQAQVLFYTAKDHAVSKDRVLRQVGLAKALVNFSNMFGTENTCESVHSQCRRMLVLQPEPDYWMHACIELSKTARPPAKDEKGKAKRRETQYDYNEGSVHDIALRVQLQLAYESFKIKFGTFSAILTSLGKEALELQLERFFTVWTWSWDLESPPPFSGSIGVRIHPLSNQLLPIIESTFEDRLPSDMTAILLSEDQIITTKDKASQYPPHLARHLLSFASPRPSQVDATAIAQDVDPPSAKEARKPPPDVGLDPRSKGGTFGKRFLAASPLSVNMHATMSAMDVRKWSWPGYLTFGASKDEQNSLGGVSTDGVAPEQVPVAMKDERDNLSTPSTSSVSTTNLHSRAASVSDVPVDSQALLDAFSNMQPGTSMHGSSSLTPDNAIVDNPSQPYEFQKVDTVESTGALDEARETAPSTDEGQLVNRVAVKSLTSNVGDDDIALPSFRTTHAYLQFDGSPELKRSRILYIYHEGLMLALIHSNDDEIDEDLSQYLAICSKDLLEKLRSVIDDEKEKTATTFQPSTVQTVLQKSQYVLSQGRDISFASPSISSTSWHLHEARQTFICSPEILEVYSRRQNPQDWHLAKRINSIKGMSGSFVYMEIGRKEASLPDVDGEISGVMRRYLGYQ